MTRLNKFRDLWNRAKRFSTKYNQPFENSWYDFNVFYNWMYPRYNKALKNCINNKSITNRSLNKDPVRIQRRNASKAYTKNNIVFVSTTQAVKFHNRTGIHKTNKVILNNKIHFIRDLVNITKKRGLIITPSGIINRIKKGEDVFKIKKQSQYLYKDKYVSLVAISKDLIISYHLLKHCINKKKMSLQQAINYSINYREHGRSYPKMNSITGRFMSKVG